MIEKVVDSVRLISTVPVPISTIVHKEEARRRFVLTNEPWVAFDRPTVPVTGLIAKIELNGQVLDGVGYYLNDEANLLGIKGLDYNSLLYLGILTDDFTVPESVTVGHFDSVYKEKYFIVPHNSYWDISGYPIVVSKKKL
jgi:hypothetical protein